jgi:hypothetical protein
MNCSFRSKISTSADDYWLFRLWMVLHIMAYSCVYLSRETTYTLYSKERPSYAVALLVETGSKL